jgi:pyruvate ferredoxin oxidoreductase gamma subunit
MFQVRLHGRGGQSVVTAAELLSVAAFVEGHHAQAFPSVGPERTGAPYGVLPDRRARGPLARARDTSRRLVVQDASLLHQVSVFEGLSLQGHLVVNSTKD